MDELEWFRFALARIGDAQGVPVVVSRTGYTGELGYEILCHPRDAEKVFDAVWEAGEPHGLEPMGLQALDMVRIEAGLIFAGYEFSDQTDPFEAGIGFSVPLKTKLDDFIGRDALIRRKEQPAAASWSGSRWTPSRRRPWRLRPCRAGRRSARSRRRMRSPVLGKNIALARLDVTHADIGTEVEIGKLDGHRSGCRRASSASRTTTRKRPGRSPDGVKDRKDKHAHVKSISPRNPPGRVTSAHVRNLFVHSFTKTLDVKRPASIFTVKKKKRLSGNT